MFRRIQKWQAAQINTRRGNIFIIFRIRICIAVGEDDVLYKTDCAFHFNSLDGSFSCILRCGGRSNTDDNVIKHLHVIVVTLIDGNIGLPRDLTK